MRLAPGDGLAVFVYGRGPVWATRQIATLVLDAVRVAGPVGLLRHAPVIGWCVARIWWAYCSTEARLAFRRWTR